LDSSSVAGIHFHAQTSGLQLRFHFFGVRDMPLADGHQPDLHRRQPQRKRTGIVSISTPKKRSTLPNRAMHHHRLMRSRLRHILELEARGQVEVVTAR